MCLLRVRAIFAGAKVVFFSNTACTVAHKNPKSRKKHFERLANKRARAPFRQTTWAEARAGRNDGGGWSLHTQRWKMP